MTLLTSLLLLAAVAAPQSQTAPAVESTALPSGEAGAKARLESSPRHGEFAAVAVPGSEVPVQSWVVYPERKDKAPVVIVIHEIFGLTDWIRSVADQLAADGFIAVAPDLLSGKGPGGKGTEALSGRDEAVKLVRGLDREEVRTRLEAVRAWARRLPAADGRSAAIGFCWGGAVSFSWAASAPDLGAAVVYYGTSPDAAQLGSIATPVLGLYGSDDERVNATIEPARLAIGSKAVYETEIYEGAGHGFLRAQDGREGANAAAAAAAWPRTIAFLRKHTGGS
ncbi:MAG TPA: dienelactone hydrolase family protein [Candidatus Polarisedimenticolia bacterium]|nr:dienelactone hydrolase family protein [Candidatus Polarisedimenticolia bacterium]